MNMNSENVKKLIDRHDEVYAKFVVGMAWFLSTAIIFAKTSEHLKEAGMTQMYIKQLATSLALAVDAFAKASGHVREEILSDITDFHIMVQDSAKKDYEPDEDVGSILPITEDVIARMRSSSTGQSPQ